MSALVKWLILAAMIFVAIYLVNMLLPNQQTFIQAAVVGLGVAALDVFLLDRKTNVVYRRGALA